MACGDDGLGRFPGESAGGDDRALKFGPVMFGGDWFGAFAKGVVALDARLDDVKLGEPEAIHLFGDIAGGLFRIAVVHIAVGTARRNADVDPVATPDRRRGLRHLEQKAGAVLDAAAIFVRARVRAVLQELIGQVAVRAMNFDAIEAGLERALRAAAEGLDDRGDLGLVQSPLGTIEGELHWRALPRLEERHIPFSRRRFSRSTNFWTLPVGVCGSRSEK